MMKSQKKSYALKDLPKWISEQNHDVTGSPNTVFHIKIVREKYEYIIKEIDYIELKTLLVFKLLENKKCTLVEGVNKGYAITLGMDIVEIKEYNLKCGKLLHLVY